MCTIAIEALTPFNRTSRIKMYKNFARSRLFRRIAKRSIVIQRMDPFFASLSLAGIMKSKTTIMDTLDFPEPLATSHKLSGRPHRRLVSELQCLDQTPKDW